MGIVWSAIQNIVNYSQDNNDILNKTNHPKDVFKYLLDQREKYASDYIDLLYFQSHQR